MFCKNCGKEMQDGSAFCPECGTKAESNDTVQANPIGAGAFQTAIASSGGTVAVKKKSKAKWIVIGVFAVLIIIVIACAVGGDDSENLTIKADNYNGLSFNYDVSEWCDSFNDSLKVVGDEYETEMNIQLTPKSFELDDTDYDSTDAYVVRYYHEEENFVISLYVDNDSNKLCKCSILWEPSVTGTDLTMVQIFGVVPSIMATSNIDYETSLSILQTYNDKSYYNDNILYQGGTINNYPAFEIQAISQETFEGQY